MAEDSTSELLVLHAVRIVGFAEASVVAHRFSLEKVEVTELLEDAEARGWVQHAGFAGLSGWSLTGSGRVENERMLADELARVGGVDELLAVHRAFVPLNARLLRACTDWQLRPVAGGRLAINDHADPGWDARVLDELRGVGHGLPPLASRLEAVLVRFGGYDSRFGAALARAEAGDGRWVDGTDVDSCHRVWFELHEDLIATLGIDRGAEV